MNTPQHYRKHRINAVDGWRGVSVLMVVISHQLLLLKPSHSLFHHFKIIAHGGLGVRFFFVISGFVIARLLLQEQAAFGTIDRLEFYKRRIVRLVPALYVFVLTSTIIFMLIGKNEGLACIAGSLTFSVGLFLNCGWDLAHLWSLTNEEAFYLIFPSVLLLVRPRYTAASFIFLLLACAILRVIDYLGSEEFPPLLLSFNRTLYSFDQMAAGVLLAVGSEKYPDINRRIFCWYPSLVRFISFLLIIGIQELSQHGLLGFICVPLGTTLQAFAFTTLMGSSIFCHRGLLYQLLTLPFLVRIGVLSYSLYLWQQLFFVPGKMNTDTLSVLTHFPLNVVCMAFLAWISYTFVEIPFKHFADRVGFLRPRKTRSENRSESSDKAA